LDRLIHAETRVQLLNRAAKKLENANTRFQDYISIAEKQSISDERNRIIREIHDSIGYTLTTIIVLGESLMERTKRYRDNQIQKVVTDVLDTARTGLTDIRIVLRILKVKIRSSLNDIAELNKMIRAFESATKIRVIVNYANIPQVLENKHRSIVFRIVQEGMVNAFRHGSASEIRISFWEQDEEYLMSVSDNGSGSGDITEGLGLAGIRERLESCGGTLRFTESPFGFELSARIPK
jgi:signal transduction histidine kinase